MDDRLDQVLQRLEAIERRLAALESRGPSAPPPPPAPSGGRQCALAGGERRLVDLLVSLTGEEVEDRLRALLRERERRDEDGHRRGRERDRRDRPDGRQD